MRKTLSKSSWSEKEDKELMKIIDQNNQYILEYGLNLAAKKLHRSLSAIRQHYYVLLHKQNEEILKRQFIDAVTSSNFKIVKRKNQFIVTL
jgi:hypothetical protein